MVGYSGINLAHDKKKKTNTSNIQQNTKCPEGNATRKKVVGGNQKKAEEEGTGGVRGLQVW